MPAIKNPLTITLDHALYWRSNLNCSVFPLLPRSKKPAIPTWKPFQSNLAPLPTTRSHFTLHPTHNLALVTGAISNLTILDLDPITTEEGGYGDLDELLSYIITNLSGGDPLVVITGSGGYHIYCRHIPFLPTSLQIPSTALLPHNASARIDIKANGGYVLAPPSIHPNGNPYTYHPTYSIPLQELTATNQLPTILTTSPLYAPLTAYQASHKLSPEDWNALLTHSTAQGSRNITTTRLTGLLLSRFHPDHWNPIVYPLLTAYNQVHNTPPLPPNELLSLFTSLAKKELTNLYGSSDPS